MIPWNVLVASVTDDHPTTHRVRQRLLAAWTSPRPVEITTAAVGAIGTDAICAHDAVVLLVDDEHSGEALRLLATIDEVGIAVLLLTDQPDPQRSVYARSDALVHGITDDDPVLAARLEGLLHRQPEVTRLRDEVALAHRFHVGLRGEISRIHEELQLAAMVQREFLPRELPAVHDFGFAALWRPAGYVSGDIYDVAQLDEDHVAVFLADAVGHGVPAALMTTVISGALTTTASCEGSIIIREPSDVLARLNREMIQRQGRTTRFATAVYALIDCRNRRLRLAGAGHPPPLLLGPNGGSRTLETDGSLLGVFENEKFGQIEVDLEPGARLLFYTDGFEQAFPADEGRDRLRLPTERYLDEFERLADHASAETMIRAMTDRIDQQQGSLHQIDDVTLICAEVRAEAGVVVPAKRLSA
jgi:serine phosphatase RsbU (regulator of sigma subunit)